MCTGPVLREQVACAEGNQGVDGCIPAWNQTEIIGMVLGELSWGLFLNLEKYDCCSHCLGKFCRRTSVSQSMSSQILFDFNLFSILFFLTYIFYVRKVSREFWEVSFVLRI